MCVVVFCVLLFLCELHVGCCLLRCAFVVCCLLMFVALFVVCCSLCAVRCVLFVVWHLARGVCVLFVCWFGLACYLGIMHWL